MEGNELAVQQQSALSVLSPSETINRAQVIANALAPIIEKQELYTVIGKKKHVWVEGWTTMLAMLNIFPGVEFVRKLDREGEIVYEARVALKTVEGRVIGSAEHMCSNREPGKAAWPEYSVKSMAQTRAVGKAARLSFSWIMSLAGYAPTPAEEMETTGSPPHVKIVQTAAVAASADKALEIRDWLGMIHNDDQAKMEAHLRELTKWKKKNKEGEYTGEEGFVDLKGLDGLARSKPDWLDKIHAKVLVTYDKFVGAA